MLTETESDGARCHAVSHAAGEASCAVQLDCCARLIWRCRARTDHIERSGLERSHVYMNEKLICAVTGSVVSLFEAHALEIVLLSVGCSRLQRASAMGLTLRRR